jgi:hypothetical protein
LTDWMLVDPPRSRAAVLRIMSHVCASKSDARNTLPYTQNTTLGQSNRPYVGYKKE